MQNPELSFPATLRVTEQTIDISGLTPRQRDFYRELFWETVAIYTSAIESRVAIGFAGPTGAGKSVVAVLLKELARQAGRSFTFEVITIDAYHFPNQYLLSHDSDGQPLKQVKGRFDTYDVPALIRDLDAFAAGQSVAFPEYSRRLHDPVPGRIPVTAPHALLLVEGLWLLSDQGAWAPVRSRLDYCYFIAADTERAREAVLRRHMNGGRTREDAMRHYEAVDGRNSALVQPTRSKADKVLPPYYLI